MNILQQPVLHAALQDNTQMALDIGLLLVALIALCVTLHRSVRPAICQAYARKLMDAQSPQAPITQGSLGKV